MHLLTLLGEVLLGSFPLMFQLKQAELSTLDIFTALVKCLLLVDSHETALEGV